MNYERVYGLEQMNLLPRISYFATKVRGQLCPILPVRMSVSVPSTRNKITSSLIFHSVTIVCVTLVTTKHMTTLIVIRPLYYLCSATLVEYQPPTIEKKRPHINQSSNVGFFLVIVDL